MKLKALSIALAVAGLSATYGAHAADDDSWTIGAYGKFKNDIGESHDRQHTWEHRRDMRAGGPFFSANVNQVEFTLKKKMKHKHGAWSEYVLRTEYGNNEGGNGQPFYGSSSGNEGHLETGQLEFKEAYVELGSLTFMPKNSSVWAGRRFLNRQQGLISKEFWKQSSGIGSGVAFGNMGLAIVSTDPGEGSGGGQSAKHNGVGANGTRTTLNSLDAYLYSVELTDTYKLDFDLKYMWRANDDQLADGAAKDGLGASVMLVGDYWGLPGWTVTALTYGQGIASNRGVNFGQWSGGFNEDDYAYFFTQNGVWTTGGMVQLGTEMTYWGLRNDDDGVWGVEQVDRLFVGVTPSIKFSDNFRLEFIGTYAIESLGKDGDWGREDKATNFMTATIAPIFTVNADYFGRPQIKTYATYMTSSHEGYRWLASSDSESDTVFGVEAEIWF